MLTNHDFRPNNINYGYGNGSLDDTLEIVFPPTLLPVNVVTTHGNIQEDFVVVAEISNMKCTLQLRLTNPRNYERMFTTEVDPKLYHELKVDQSLHVTFSAFVENIRKILMECQKKEMRINFVQTDNLNYMLKFVEVRSFRNLVHLVLPIKPASEANIIFHMKKSMQQLEKQCESHKNAVQHTTHQLKHKDSIIDQLKKDLASTKSCYEDQIRQSNSRTNDDVNMLRSSVNKLTEEKRQDKCNFDLKVAEFQAIISQLRTENGSLVEQKMHVIKENESLREEVCVNKSNLASLKMQNEKLSTELQGRRHNESDFEVHRKQLKKQLSSLQKSLKEKEKMNNNLMAELEAEKKVCNAKRMALQVAADNIGIANDTISKQSSEIEKLKETIEWRHDMSRQHELIAREKENQVHIQNKQIDKLMVNLKGLGEHMDSYETVLEDLKNVAYAVSTKYSQRVKDLIHTLDSTPSTPRMPPLMNR